LGKERWRCASCPSAARRPPLSFDRIARPRLSRDGKAVAARESPGRSRPASDGDAASGQGLRSAGLRRSLTRADAACAGRLR